MSSLLRRMQRRNLRRAPDYEAPAQPTIVREGYYKTLHPTRGWKVVSNKRVRAEHGIARMLEIGGILADKRRSTPKLAKVWRKPAPVPAGTVTRQQRRAALRYGLEIAA